MRSTVSPAGGDSWPRTRSPRRSPGRSNTGTGSAIRSAWIYRTAFRLASRELQREKRQPPQPPDPSPGIDPFDVQEILAALARLSPNQRAAVLLHDEEGFTGPEVGRLLGMSAATVRVHLFRGRKHLRALLSTEEDSDG